MGDPGSVWVEREVETVPIEAAGTSQYNVKHANKDVRKAHKRAIKAAKAEKRKEKLKKSAKKRSTGKGKKKR